MFEKILLKLKLKRSAASTKRQLEKRLCNYKNPFTAYDIHTVYRMLKQQEAPVLISPNINGKTIEVGIDQNPIDWFSIRIKYSVPMMDIIIRIKVFAGAPQVGSCESDTINLKVESIIDDTKPRRKIVERDMSFINAIDYRNLESDCKTPALEGNLLSIKKILSDSFGVIINYLIDWRKVS